MYHDIHRISFHVYRDIYRITSQYQALTLTEIGTSITIFVPQLSNFVESQGSLQTPIIFPSFHQRVLDMISEKLISLNLIIAHVNALIPNPNLI